MKPKIHYFTQQLASHFGVVALAFLLLSLLLSHYVEKIVFDNKTEELIQYGTGILADSQAQPFNQGTVLEQYGQVLGKRSIQYSLFDQHSTIVYSSNVPQPTIQLQQQEWQALKNGQTISVRQSSKRFGEDVTFVLQPYFFQNQFLGGILLTSPVQGSQALVASLNKILLLVTGVVLLIALLISFLAATLHVRRITTIRNATEQLAAGDYTVRLPASSFDEISLLAGEFNQMTAQLQQSMEEIEQLERRRRRFMADVSHELRTPLTTIRGIIEGLQNELISPEEKQRGLQLANKEVRRLLRLVNENLDYEKIRSNQVQLHKELIEVRPFLEVIREQVQGIASEKGNTITIQAMPDLCCWADYDRLTQILLNLLKNSIQFTQNGTITLEALEKENQTVFTISDTGIGIPAGEIEQIWERFYKAIDSRTTNPYGEFGLGLSIVKQLMIVHNGEVDVSSQPTGGTTFTLRFPIEKEATFSS